MILLATLWFFLPAGIANMAPVFVSRWPLLKHWNTPLDRGHSWRGKRLFGDNKTWRGLLAGTIVAALVSVLQQLTWPMPELALPNAFLVGAALGFGALAGDAIASFIKRQHDVAAGKGWVPLDQIDYIIGGLLVVYPFASDFLGIGQITLIIMLYTGLHFAFSYIGYVVGLKERPL